MGKVYPKKDINLISRSSVYNNYEVLRSLFRLYPNLCKGEISSLPEMYQIFLKDVYPNIRKQATQEWRVDKSIKVKVAEEGENFRCQLCGTKIKYKCSIRNSITQDIMEVGSECVTHFGIKNWRELKKDINDIQETMRKSKRLEKLSYEIPHIEHKINTWNNFINNQPKFINKYVRNKYISMGKSISEIYNKYIKSSNNIEKDNVMVSEIKKILEQSEIEKEKINDYIIKNKNNDKIPDRLVIDYCKKFDSVALKDIEANNGFSIESLLRIHDKDFVKGLIPKFNKVFKIYGIEIENINNYKHMGYDFIIQKQPNVNLFIYYTQIIRKYGNIILESKVNIPIEQKNFINDGKLMDYSSVDYGLGQLETFLIYYDLYYDEFYYDLSKIVWRKGKKKHEKYFLETDISKIRDLVKDISFYKEKYNKDKIYDIIRNNSKLIKNEDMEQIKKDRYKML